MRSSADVVIIGAGIMGLSVAYNLAKRHGLTKVSVLDATYLCGGASGRNGGGVRAQWSDESNIRLMQRSLALFREFAREHRINTWFRQGGYLFLTRAPEQAAALRESVALQQRCGLASELVEPGELRRIVPELDPAGVLLGSYNPDDAVVFPWPFVWGYAQGASELGVEIVPFTRVIAIERGPNGIERVVSERGSIATKIVLNACGAFSPHVADMVGVKLPTRPHRHEICASEALKPWLLPLVADLSNGLYFSQSMRGEIVGGISNERVPAGESQESSARFLALYARAVVKLIPRLSALKVVRQWAGLYDLSPDATPIVGAVDEVPGFYLASGFMGHGFMMAPIIGQLLAKAIAERTLPPELDGYRLSRFGAGAILAPGDKTNVGHRERMIIG
ncbi:MAG TPA: FAD-binding oxidoreductase [Polyangiaceae bacterium]|nr:FAD-binding oxidoreductase [Polyangiaceae bacterium]